MEEVFEEMYLHSAVNSTDPDEPKLFNEAWHHTIPEERKKWREALEKNSRT